MKIKQKNFSPNLNALSLRGYEKQTQYLKKRSAFMIFGKNYLASLNF